MNELYRNMLEAYDLTTAQDVRNATFEVNQQIILSGLAECLILQVLGVLERVILHVLWAWECAFWGVLMGCQRRLILEKV